MNLTYTGVLTPAQSVLGAVQGIEVVQPNITTPVIIGVTDAILVLLFFIQPLGVSKISLGFSPVIVIWFILLLVFGIYNTAVYDATVWKAWNPYYAFDFLIRNKESGWRQLGGVLLCFTGVEALFADVSGFSRRAIQLSWLCFTFPCLLFAYIGQAAYISVHPDAYSNPLFKSVPGGKGVLYFTLVMAILAAIVASQAIITATFQVSRVEECSDPVLILVASSAGDETLLLPAAKGGAHFQVASRAALYTRRKLAAHDWHHPCGVSLQ